MGGHPCSWQLPDGVFSPLTCHSRCCHSEVAGLDRDPEGVHWRLRHVPVGPGDGHPLGGALLAGLIFGFGLFFVSGSRGLRPASGHFSLDVLLTDRLVRRPDALSVAGLAVLVSFAFFGGHPESTFHVLFLTVAFLALRLAQRNRGHLREWRRLVRPVLTWAGAVLLGSALAAIIILPFAEAVLGSAELGRRTASEAVATREPVHHRAVPVGLLREAHPAVVRRPDRGPRAVRGGPAAAAGGVRLVVRPNLERVATAGMAVFSLLMVFGVRPVAPVVRLVPGFGSVHNTRMTIIFLLCVGLLAAWGLQELMERELSRRVRRALVAGAAAMLVIPAALVMGSGRAPLGVLDQGIQVALALKDMPPGPDARSIAIASSMFIWTAFAAGSWRWSRCACAGAWPPYRWRCWPSPWSPSISSGPGWARTRRSRWRTRASRPHLPSATCRPARRRASLARTRRTSWPRSRCLPTPPCVTGSSTPAATTSRSRSATTEL